jgi:hypothetical protein
LRGEVTVFIEPATLTHGFFQVLRAAKFTVVDMPNFKAKTVRSQIDSGKAIS